MFTNNPYLDRLLLKSIEDSAVSESRVQLIEHALSQVDMTSPGSDDIDLALSIICDELNAFRKLYLNGKRASISTREQDFLIKVLRAYRSLCEGRVDYRDWAEILRR